MCGPHHCLGRDAFASGPEILRRLLQLRQNASILEQGCAGHSPNSANRKHQITRHPWRTSPPLRPSLSFRYTQGSNGVSANASPLLSLTPQRTFLCRPVVGVERTTQIGSASPTRPVPSEAKSDGLTYPGRGALKWQI